MSDLGIFAATAPAYFALGLPVIPLYRREKRPVPLDWSRYHDMPVEAHEQEHWLRQFHDGNIGMVLGKQSGVMMLDIDSEDESIVELIRSLLPVSPWVRVGQKGMVLAFRYTGLKTFRIKTSKGESVCELLSDRTQCVLPPSIHPKTQQPYRANCDLLSVIKSLPVLNPQVEHILRGALKEAGLDLSTSGQSKVLDFVSRGSRDVSMTERAGLFAHAVVRGERSVVEAVGMLRSFNTEFVERVAGDDIEIEKHVENLLRFLRRDVLEKGKTLPEGWDEGLTEEMKDQWGINFDQDRVEWSFGEMRDYLKDQFSAHDAESEMRSRAIDKVLTKMAASNNLNKLDEERLTQYIADVSGTGLKLGALRRRLVELRQGDILGTDHSEIARRVLADLMEIHLVRQHAGVLWKYSGSHWELLEESMVLAKISNEFGSMAAAKRNSDHKGILAVMLVIAEEGIKDTTMAGVNFANGFLTEDLELVKHKPEYGMTYTLPFRYLPELAGKSPMFFEFLEQSWGDDPDYADKKLGLQEALGVTFFGLGPRFQRVVLLKGIPKSGKSQLLRIAQSLVPEGAACYVPPNEWSDRFMPTQMHGKLINVCGELSDKKLIDGQRFKDIVDGTEMSGQLKGKNIFQFRPLCMHWFASNHSPRTDDSSDGFNRRWLFLEFNKPVSEKDRKLDLGEMIVAEEREAIVAWAVLAISRINKSREYTLSQSHEQGIREVAQANNSVRFFMEESPVVRLKTSGRTSEVTLFNEYWGFCFGPGGAKPVSSKQFRAALRELQHHLGFKMVIEKTELGGQEVYYEYVTIASGKGKGRKSKSTD